MEIDKNRASEQVRDDRNRQKVKNKDSATNSQVAQHAGRSQQTKEAKSAFDLVLENLNNPRLPSSETSKFDSKIKESLSERDHSRDKSDSKKDKEDEKKTTSSEEKGNTSSVRGGYARYKIMGKQGQKGEEGFGGNTGGREQGNSGSSNPSRLGKQSFTSKPEIAPVGIQEGMIKAASVSQPEGVAKASVVREIPKQVLDHIVQQIRIGLNKDLDQEIQIDLQDKIFRSLSLKVSSHQGKVQISFLTGDAEVKRLFERQKEKIAEALSQKGVAVASIQIQSLG